MNGGANDDDLLEKLKSFSTEKLVAKEKSKNKLEDAHEQEQIKQSENRTRIGRFAVDWVIGAVKIASALVFLMCLANICYIVQEPVKLEAALKALHSEIKDFIVNYQSVIAVVATLMFGDKLKSKDKK